MSSPGFHRAMQYSRDIRSSTLGRGLHHAPPEAGHDARPRDSLYYGTTAGRRRSSARECNIHAGSKYNRWVADNCYKDPVITPFNRQLFAFASDKAGPRRVGCLRAEARASGLDPNGWFNNVELVAA